MRFEERIWAWLGLADDGAARCEIEECPRSGWERKAKMQAQGGGRARKRVGCMCVCVVVRSGVAFRRGGAAKQDEPGFW